MQKTTLKSLVILIAGLYSMICHAQEADYTEKELVSPRINSRFEEANPVISGDGETLFFSRRFHPENMNGREDHQDVWYSKKYKDGQWSKPMNMGENINGPDFDAICSVSPDGKIAMFFNTYKKRHHPIAVARHDASGAWEKPHPVKISDYYNHHQFADFHHSFIQNVLFMAVQRDDSKGDQDLYLSFLQEDGTYGEPQNLGPVVNTKKSDFAPFLGHDNMSLFFASYGHDGLGGSDLYVTYRLDETWMKWSEPVNLGPFINTPGDETYISVTADFKYMYFDSHDPDSKIRDLYRAETPLKFNPFQRSYARK